MKYGPVLMEEDTIAMKAARLVSSLLYVQAFALDSHFP